MSSDAVDVKFTPVETGAVEKSTALVARNDQAMLFPASTPAERVAQMVELAQVFVGLARQRNTEAIAAGRAPLIVPMENKKAGTTSEHITVPLWRTLGALLPRSITATTESTEQLPNGFRARAAVRTLDGTVLGYADAECTRAELQWSRAPSNAVMSMAQTRAQGKAFRSVLDFLVVLAGFNPTPAEEMPKDPEPAPDPAPNQSYEPHEPRKKGKPVDDGRRARVFSRIDDYKKVLAHWREADPDYAAQLEERMKVVTDDDLRHSMYQRLFKAHRLDDLSPAQVDKFCAMIDERINDETDKLAALGERR